MSPTVARWREYRFFFFSREEPRAHIHVESSHGEAKFWLEPMVELAQSYRFAPEELNELRSFVEEKRNELINSWRKHFPD